MARILWPPIMYGGVFHLAGFSLALVGRLRPVHILTWVVLASVLLIITGLLVDAHKKALPVFDAWDLLDLDDGEPTVPPGLSPQQPIRIAKAGRFDDRYEFQHYLGQGGQGDVAIYTDTHTGSPVALKSFFSPGHQPMPKPWLSLFSNQLSTWPSEIPATLLLASLHRHHSTHNLTHQDALLSHPIVTTGLLPALDFFIALHSSPPLRLPGRSARSWHLVTPYIPHGATLASLARSLGQAGNNNSHTTVADVDSAALPNLARLLSALATLHAKGYCHNDVKPDNIFVVLLPGPPPPSSLTTAHALDRSRWLLADLGQLRSVAHPWHASRGWAWRNQWHDCAKNDVRCTLKSYLAFVRGVVGEAERARFDRAFFAEGAALSSLYWDFVREPVGAEEMVGKVRGTAYREEEGGGNGTVKWGDAVVLEREPLLGLRVEKELTCTSVRGWRWVRVDVQLMLERLWGVFRRVEE